jgi:hypothetical protein
MLKKKVMKEEQHNKFVLALSGTNIDMTTINIEEMTGYCNIRGRLANVITEKKSYGELEKLNYSLIMNYNHPKPRVINTKKKPYLHVYEILSEKFSKGLIIAESDTISNSITDYLCTSENWANNDIDIMICKDFASVTMAELQRANLLRISADPDFDFTSLMKYEAIFKEKLPTIMICQNFVNDVYNSVEAYMNVQNKKYQDLGVKEYIDYGELNRQLAYFVYFDVENNKIIGIDKPTMVEFLMRMRAIIGIPEDQIEIYSEMITIN